MIRTRCNLQTACHSLPESQLQQLSTKTSPTWKEVVCGEEVSNLAMKLTAAGRFAADRHQLLLLRWNKLPKLVLPKWQDILQCTSSCCVHVLLELIPLDHCQGSFIVHVKPETNLHLKWVESDKRCNWGRLSFTAICKYLNKGRHTSYSLDLSIHFSKKKTIF